MDKSGPGQSITGISSTSEELDSRSMFRRRQYKGAVLTYQEEHVPHTCLVRDLSDPGRKDSNNWIGHATRSIYLKNRSRRDLG